MKKLILLIVVLFPSLSMAGAHGCYTTDGYNCYNASIPFCYGSISENQYWYGTAVGLLCSDWYTAASQRDFYKADVNRVVKQANKTIKRLLTTESKLRKACGSKCSRVK